MYEGEDTVYYWNKKYERKARTSDSCKKLKEKKIKAFLPFLWVMVKTFFNFLILDKGSKYFTSPWRVFSLMIFVLFLWFGLYWGVNQWGNEKWGYLITSEEMVFEAVPRDGNFVTTLISSDPVILKESCTHNGDLYEWEFARYNAYFSLITFTTIGYSDIQPSGRLQLFAGIEGFLGVLLMSLFLVTSAKKVLW